MLARSTLVAILIACAAVYSRLDATPSLILAEVYVRARPDLLRDAFDGAVTLITGASDGIGAETAKQLCARTSAHLVLLARRGELLDSVERECLSLARTHGTDATVATVACDVTAVGDDVAQRKCLDVALNELGKSEVDVAVVNAGRGYRSTVMDTEVQLVRDIMELNYLGAVSTVKAVLSTYGDDDGGEREKKKRIIAVSSVASKLPGPVAAGYAASKAAMNSFFDSVRAEYGTSVRVTTVLPGPVRTNIKSNSRRDNQRGPEYMTETEKEFQRVDDSKMTVERAVSLMLAGCVASPTFLFYELWLSPQPILTYAYVGQYFPDLAKFVGRPVGRCSGSSLCEAAKKLHEKRS